MTKQFSRVCLVSAALLLGSTAPLVAQDIGFGAAASYGDNTDLGIGPRVLVPITAGELQLHIVGSLDYFFPDSGTGGVDVTYFEVNGNVLLDIPLAEATVAPYAGAGLSYARSGVETPNRSAVFTSEVGLNILGGVRFGSGGLSPFVEGRYSTAFDGQAVLSAGVLFKM